MAVPAVSSIANVKRSFDVYINTQLAASFNAADQGIDWEGVPFNDAGLREWIQPRILGPARPEALFYRQVPAGLGLNSFGHTTVIHPAGRGQGVIYIAQVNIFIRPARELAVAQPAHRIHQLRDLVLEKLREFTTIRVLDYEGATNNVLGSMIVRRLNMDQEIPVDAAKEDFRQWCIGADAHWTEVF